VLYDDLAPWPMLADGLGRSLQRKAPVFYGNDAGSWKAEIPSPGSIDFSGNVEGDFNNDGQLTADDIDVLFDAAHSPNAALYLDFDGSFSVNPGDVTIFLQTVVGSRFGDANLDGVVDGSDFNIWNDNKFQSCNKSWAEGDFNGDAAVDASDFNIWFINRFTTAPPVAAAVGNTPHAAAAERLHDVAVVAPSLDDDQNDAVSHEAYSARETDLTAQQPDTAIDHFFASFEIRSRYLRNHAQATDSATKAVDLEEPLRTSWSPGLGAVSSYIVLTSGISS
jgi:hypothetical protein